MVAQLQPSSVPLMSLTKPSSSPETQLTRESEHAHLHHNLTLKKLLSTYLPTFLGVVSLLSVFLTLLPAEATVAATTLLFKRQNTIGGGNSNNGGNSKVSGTWNNLYIMCVAFQPSHGHY